MPEEQQQEQVVDKLRFHLAITQLGKDNTMQRAQLRCGV